MYEELPGSRTGGRPLHIPEMISIEMGSSLSYILKNDGGEAFPGGINRLRYKLAREWGFELPPFLIQENPALDPKTYRFVMSNSEIAKCRIPPGKTLIITSAEKISRIPGSRGEDPVFRLPCVWVEPRDSHFYSNTEPYSASTGQVITEHLESELRLRASDFITRETVLEKIEDLKSSDPGIPFEASNDFDLSRLTDIMKNLVPEGISLDHIDGALRIMSNENFPVSGSEEAAERIRNSLRHAIHRQAFRDNSILFAAPDSNLQKYIFLKAGQNKKIPENDPIASKMVREIVNLHIAFRRKGFRLGIICSSPLRLIFRHLLEKSLPDIIVLKPDEIDPGESIRIIRTLKGSSVKFHLSRLLFGISASKRQKIEFKNGIGNFNNFMDAKRYQAAISISSNNEDKNAVDSSPRIAERPAAMPHAPAILNNRQKAAIFLQSCDEKYLKKILERLTIQETAMLGLEISALPAEFKGFRGEIIRGGSGFSESRLLETVRGIRSSFEGDSFTFSITPLQSLTIFLSSLHPRTAEKMYQTALSEISDNELERLILNNDDRKIISLAENRLWLIEDFMWFVKGGSQPIAPYSETYWAGDLQRIALRSPGKLADALKDLWLSPAETIGRFNKFVEKWPSAATFWIRKYITSSKERSVNLRILEKACILMDLLPGELSEEVANRLDETWRRIFKNMPRRPEIIKPEESGIVLTQFLSHFYSKYEKELASKIQLN